MHYQDNDSDLPCLNDTPCRIEDRRAQSSRDKPSSVFELLCEDCGNHFLIVVAVADATDYTSVCRECWNARAVLTVEGTNMRPKKVRLNPDKDDVPEFLNQKIPQYDNAVIHHNGVDRYWFQDSEGWKERGNLY